MYNEASTPVEHATTRQNNLPQNSNTPGAVGEEEEEEIDIISGGGGNSFTFPQPSPSCFDPTAIPILYPPEDFSINDSKQRQQQQEEKESNINRKQSSANRRRQKRHRVSFDLGPGKEEEQEQEDVEPVDIDIKHASHDISTLIQTPYSNVQPKKHKHKLSKKVKRFSSSATTQALEEHQHNYNIKEDGYTETVITDEDTSSEAHKEPDKLAVATAELQTAVQQARALVPFPIPSAGLLAIASLALQNETSSIHTSYLTKCLGISATLIQAMAAEIAQLEQEKSLVAASPAPAALNPPPQANNEHHLATFPSWQAREDRREEIPLINTATITTGAALPYRHRQEDNFIDGHGIVSLQTAAQQRKVEGEQHQRVIKNQRQQEQLRKQRKIILQQRQQQQLRLVVQPPTVIVKGEDPMYALNSMLGIETKQKG